MSQETMVISRNLGAGDGDPPGSTLRRGSSGVSAGSPVIRHRLRTFAEAHRLRTRRDEDNTLMIPGKVGHIWEFDEDLLAVTLLNLTNGKWSGEKRGRRKPCCDVGMKLHQDGDCEGTLLFDPEDAEQVELALRVAEVKRRRWMSPENKQRFVEAGKATRFKSSRR